MATYNKTDWENLPSTDTPVTANNLNKIEDALEAVYNMIYPVGSIYMSVNNVNPSTLFGGTWVAWGAGKVPVGVDANDTEFDGVEETGGSKTHSITVSEMPQHNHTYDKAGGTTGQSSGDTGPYTLKVADIPGHTHKYDADGHGVWLQNSGYGNITAESTTGANRINLGSSTTASTGGGGSHKHSLGNHTHTVSNSSTNTGNKGSGTAMSLLQPYITCYMWKRTA